MGRRAIAVPFTIPGERVRIRIGGSAKQDPPYAVSATLVAVLRPSPHRVSPRCPHFGPNAEPGLGPCGGCNWQHIAYPEQLRLKTALVDRLVRAAVPRAPAARPMMPSIPVDDPWGYRHKVHFVFGGRSMGHYVRGSRRVVPVRACPVHDPRGNALAFRFRHAFAGITGHGDTETRSHTLQGIAIRVGANTSEITATLVVTGEPDKRLRAATRRALADARRAKAEPTALHVNLHPRRNALIFGRDTRRISGPARMRESVGDISFLISPTAFFQTNVHAAEILVRLVMAEIGPPQLAILDLYAGAGLFALPLARAGHEVVAVEENAIAVADGEASRALNGIPPDRCRFIARPVEDALSGHQPDVIVLDPPREGCAPPVLRRVFGEMRPGRAVYISCNPEALAQDLALIAAHGYTIRSLQPVDMFPHTAHIETVATLAR